MKRILLRSIISILGTCLVLIGCDNSKKVNKNHLEDKNEFGKISSDSYVSEDKIDLMGDIVAHYHPVNNSIINEKSFLYNSFALRLFQNSIEKNKNTLLSPLGIVYSMGVVTTGARADTLKQMENVFGVSHDEMNEYVNSYIHKSDGDSSGDLKAQCSVWINKDINIEAYDKILQLNADIYKHDMYSVKFNKSTLENINAWVCNNNSFVVNHILESISPKDSMYLVGLTSFEGKWANSYAKKRIKEQRKFKSYFGQERTVKMLHSHERIYLTGKNCNGFMKFYDNKNYAFVALLPNKSLDIQEFIRSLDAVELNDLFANYMDIEVIAEIPEFRVESNVDVEHIFKKMGMSRVFDNKLADLRGIGKLAKGKRLFISKALQKVFFMIDESESIDDRTEGLCEEDQQKNLIDDLKKEVILDRPFVYMVIDTRHNIPLLMGTLMDVK